MLNASQKRTNRAAFSPASMLSVPAIALGWFAMTPTVRPSTRPKPTTMFGANSGCVSRKSSLSTMCSMIVFTSYGWFGRVRDERVELAVVVGDLELDVALVDLRLCEVVVGQEADERARVVERVILVAREVVRDTGDLVVGEGAAELLHADVLAGDGLDHVGAGDEHLAGLVDHDHEVGERGGVHRAAGCRAHDDRDLRDDAGGLGVAAEDLAVLAERDDALLDARAAGVEHADDRHAGLDGVVHDLDDLLAGDLAERAAEDGEVLRSRPRPAGRGWCRGR